MDFLHRALSTAAFRRVWREALDKLNDALWDGVLMRHSFTAFGAAQFARDLHAVASLVERYIPDGSAMLLSVQEGMRLLSLPLDAPGDAEGSGRAGGQSVITLRQANDRILMDEVDARKLLEELGIETLTLANARHILQRRVEVSA